MGLCHGMNPLYNFIDDNTISDNGKMLFDYEDIPENIVWLSYICLFWIWPDDANDILSFIQNPICGEILNAKSVIDIIYAAKKYRKKQHKTHMSEDELIRFRMFSRFRKACGTQRFPIFSITNTLSGHTMEYIKGRRFIHRYD